MNEFNIDDGIGNYIGGPFRGEHDAAVEWARGYARKRNEIVYLYAASGPDAALEPVGPAWSAADLDPAATPEALATLDKLRNEAHDVDDSRTVALCEIAAGPNALPVEGGLATRKRARVLLAKHLNSVAQAGL